MELIERAYRLMIEWGYKWRYRMPDGTQTLRAPSLEEVNEGIVRMKSTLDENEPGTSIQAGRFYMTKTHEEGRDVYDLFIHIGEME